MWAAPAVAGHPHPGGYHPVPSASQDTLKDAGEKEKDAAVYSAAAPFAAPVVSAQRLSAEWSDRVVIHVELALPGWQMPLPRAGDSVGVMPRNDPELVEALLRRLGRTRTESLWSSQGGGRWVTSQPRARCAARGRATATSRGSPRRGCCGSWRSTAATSRKSTC